MKKATPGGVTGSLCQVFKKKRYSIPLKKILLIHCFCIITLPFYAQKTVIRPLTVGDKVPDIAFENIINSKQKKSSLYTFKKKNIIIDLWSRYCTACISSFPKIERLQNKYKDQLQFILANPHDVGYEKEVTALLEGVKKRTGFYPSIPIALDDTILNHYFPHEGVPHYIWIDPDFRIAAITGLEELTEQQVNSFIKGNKLHLAAKDDAQSAKDLITLIREGEATDSSLISYSIFTGYQPYTSLKTGYEKRVDNAILSYHVINTALHYIIDIAFQSELAGIPDNRILNYPAIRNQIYCYQLKLRNPLINPQELQPLIRLDLQRTFGIEGKRRKKEMECIVITDIKRISALKTRSPNSEISFSAKNTSKRFIHRLELNKALQYLDQLPQPLINESVYTNDLVDFDFPTGFDPKNQQDLLKWFNDNGFVIKQEKRLLDVFEFFTQN